MGSALAARRMKKQMSVTPSSVGIIRHARLIKYRHIVLTLRPGLTPAPPKNPRNESPPVIPERLVYADAPSSTRASSAARCKVVRHTKFVLVHDTTHCAAPRQTRF